MRMTMMLYDLLWFLTSISDSVNKQSITMNLPFSSLVLFRFLDNNSQLPFIVHFGSTKNKNKFINLCVWLLFHKLMFLMYLHRTRLVG